MDSSTISAGLTAAAFSLPVFALTIALLVENSRMKRGVKTKVSALENRA